MDPKINGMETYFAIATVRAVREYSDQPIPDALLQRILQAGRATGSSANRQPWTFYVVRNKSTMDALAELVYEPDNIRGCQLAIAVVVPRRGVFDAGRAAQNMILAAHGAGIGTCPNTTPEVEAVRELLGTGVDVAIPVILSVGYPQKPLRPKDRDPDAILSRMKRKPLEEITRFID